MSFPQLGYQYIRPLYPPERPGAAGGGGSAGSRGGPGAGASELAASGSLSNVLSSVYGAPYAAAAAAAAAAQGYGAFLPYAAELPIFPQLVSARGALWMRGEVGSWGRAGVEGARPGARAGGGGDGGQDSRALPPRVSLPSRCAYRARSMS